MCFKIQVDPLMMRDSFGGQSFHTLRASVFGIVKLLICYILASNHKREALPQRFIVNKFTTELQQCPKFRTYCSKVAKIKQCFLFLILLKYLILSLFSASHLLSLSLSLCYFIVQIYYFNVLYMKIKVEMLCIL